MRPPSAEALLAVWEMGRDRHLVDRAVLLHALAVPGVERERVADEPLGRRNAALLRLRLATFGSAMRAYLDCTRCRAQLEFEMDAATLLAEPADEATLVEVDGRVFRSPTSRDLAALLNAAPVDKPWLQLLRLCLIDGEGRTDDAALEPLLERVEAELEQADPWADVTLDFHCEACGHTWTTPFDIAAFLWEEMDAYASRLLDEVHLLARAYGWSETAILALPEYRRAAYLERVTA